MSDPPTSLDVMTRTRQPRGVPVGGQYAVETRRPASVILDLLDVEDPWAPPTTPTGLAATAEALGRRLTDAHLTGEDWAELEQSVTGFGHEVAHRAHAIAGLTPQEAQQRWRQRLLAAEEAEKGELVEWRDARQARLARLREIGYQMRAHPLGSPEFDALLAESSRLNSELGIPEAVAALEAHMAAARRRDEGREGLDAGTLADRRVLADAYQQALGEVRGMGGPMRWHPDSQARAVRAFGEATGVFPTDWVDASNARIGSLRDAPMMRGG
ncbi:hypothetical protein U6M47_12340, partial [Cutibacterium acnes]